jgi:hypothetical protein
LLTFKYNAVSSPTFGKRRDSPASSRRPPHPIGSSAASGTKVPPSAGSALPDVPSPHTAEKTSLQTSPRARAQPVDITRGADPTDRVNQLQINSWALFVLYNGISFSMSFSGFNGFFSSKLMQLLCHILLPIIYLKGFSGPTN